MPTRGKPTAAYYTRTWRIWAGMKARCVTPSSGAYKYYGAKGIRFSLRWMKFKNFLADMGECPTDHVLDRIDPSWWYVPGNCRWTTVKINSRNKINTVKVTFRGETKPLTEWADTLGVKYGTLLARLTRYKWSVEQAFTLPDARGRGRSPNARS